MFRIYSQNETNFFFVFLKCCLLFWFVWFLFWLFKLKNNNKNKINLKKQLTLFVVLFINRMYVYVHRSQCGLWKAIVANKVDLRHVCRGVDVQNR